MTHEERSKAVAELLKGDVKPPVEFYEKNVWNKSSEIAILNLYDWFKEKGLTN